MLTTWRALFQQALIYLPKKETLLRESSYECFITRVDSRRSVTFTDWSVQNRERWNTSRRSKSAFSKLVEASSPSAGCLRICGTKLPNMLSSGQKPIHRGLSDAFLQTAASGSELNIKRKFGTLGLKSASHSDAISSHMCRKSSKLTSKPFKMVPTYRVNHRMILAIPEANKARVYNLSFANVFYQSFSFLILPCFFFFKYLWKQNKNNPPRIIIKLDSKMNINMDLISSLEIERIEHIFKTCLLQFGCNSKPNPFLILRPKTLCFQLQSYSFFAQGYKSDGCVFRFQLYMKHQLRLLSL